MTRDRNALLDRLEGRLPVTPDAFDRLRVRRERTLVRRRVAAAAAGVGLTAALVGSLLTLRTGSEAPPPMRSEPSGTPVQLVAQPGQYYYVRLFHGEDTTNERWYGPDGSGRFTTSVNGEVVDDRSFSAGELTTKMYSELSTEPDLLIAQISDRSGVSGPSPISVPTPAPSPDEDTLVLMAMSDLLGFGSDYLVPEQTAAVFRAASAMEGVTVDRHVDPYDRDAVSLSWTYRDGNSAVLVRWYFEPATHQFMGEWRFDSATGGGVMSIRVVEVAGIVDAVDERPHPSARYVPRAIHEVESGRAGDGPVTEASS